MPLEYRPRILALAAHSPLLPAQVAKALETSHLLASAMLSEMVSAGLLKISKLKIGSSPLYYLPNNREQLLRYTEHLNEKDQRVLDMLQKKGVVLDTELEPLARVSLRKALGDFTEALEVPSNGSKLLVWKYVHLPEDQAKELLSALTPQPAKPKLSTNIKPKVTPKQRTTTARKPRQPRQPAGQSTLAAVPDPFADKLKAFFQANNISIVREHIKPENKEWHFVVDLPSAVSTFTCYAVFLTGKRVTEGSISAAVLAASRRGLPPLLLFENPPTKKAASFLEKNKIAHKQIQ